MKKWIRNTAIAAVVTTGSYFAGPAPDAPSLTMPQFALPDSMTALEGFINKREMTTPNLRADNEARIVWANAVERNRTKQVVLYIHGFSATQEEGNPVHRNLAKRLGANLYLARLAGHGIEPSDTTMQSLTTDQLIYSAEEAIEIAKKLGDEILVVGTSFGAALSLHLATHHPEIKTLVLTSPCIEIYDKNAALLDNPWGLQMARLVTGSTVRKFPATKGPKQAHYWTTQYHMNGVIAVQNFLTHVMTPETFGKVKCPVMLCYWYKNEEEQDKVVSVPAMLRMFDALGTPADKKYKVAIPEAGNHVMTSFIMSSDLSTPENEIGIFLKKQGWNIL